MVIKIYKRCYISTYRRFPPAAPKGSHVISEADHLFKRSSSMTKIKRIIYRYVYKFI